MLPILFGIGCFISTYLGGLLALRWSDHKHLLLAWSSGSLITVGVLDLLKESIHLTSNIEISLICFILGLFGYHIINNVIPLIYHAKDCDNIKHKSQLATSFLCAHSVMDGLAIGLAFKISIAFSIVVMCAICAHDSQDGLNVVVKSHDKQSALKWLFFDAIAPLIGILIALFINVPDKLFGGLLGIFAAFFVYIGMASLIDESHHDHPKFWNILLTFAGALFIFLIIKIAG